MKVECLRFNDNQIHRGRNRGEKEKEAIVSPLATDQRYTNVWFEQIISLKIAEISKFFFVSALFGAQTQPNRRNLLQFG